MFILLVATILLMVLLSASAVSGGGKLIIGFETEELRGKKGSTWCEIKEVQGGCDFWAHFEYGGAGSRAWTWNCRQGQCTEGKQALVRVVAARGEPLSFKRSPFLDRYYPALRQGADATVILNTFQWLAHAEAHLRDWSSFQRLWVDVRSDRAFKAWLTVEDETIEPPVVGCFDMPVGKWVTLELDLEEAKRARDLDLAHIANIYLLGNATEGTTICVDNVRVVPRDAKADIQVLRDTRPMTVPRSGFPRTPAMPPLSAEYRPDRSPVKLEAARRIAQGSVVPYGWIAAADNRHLLLGCTQGKDRSDQRAVMMESSDGGATWSELPAPIARNFDHGSSRGCVVDANGDSVAVSSGPGCAGIGVATPRQHLTKYTFTGKGWVRRESATILDSDIRHCGSAASVIRLPRGPHKGRLWAAWGAVDRMRRLVVHCRYSDDDGETWWHDGKSALVPGSEEADFSLNSYSYQQPRIAYFRGQAAVFWQDARGLRWSRYEGERWSPAEPIDADAKVNVAVSENESFRVPGSVVTVDEDQVFLTAWSRGGVFRFDGRTWSRELPDAEDAGTLTVCGDRDVMLITSGHTEQPPPTKRIEIRRQARVLCYRRKHDGTWAEPLDISDGAVTLHEYRQMTGVVVPPMSPPNFAPVAFSDGQTVLMVRVPALVP